MPAFPGTPQTTADGTLDLWNLCHTGLQPFPLEGELLRLVESQEQVATTGLVDDLAEQSLLEDLLEPSKPPRRPGTQRLHYLLATPFRYPPLPHGSRFGSRLEPGIFYAALGETAALAECAYYRLVFWSAMCTPPPSGRLMTQHTLFRALYRGTRGLRLQAPPCAAHEPVLRHPCDYGPTQRLGRALRDAGVELIEYRSARDPASGLNLALFDPAALASRRPLDPEPWLCETRADRVIFSGPRGRTVQGFHLADFTIAGRLPLPAA
ncbi:RES family NAD+ phosphorylase [uncultured Thiodictyon sp.]|jgi:hypothetical protein|uniref:RES family NAD+ phosphorylase n=1 Tax=uncultured Thiodictyon sp. TaxID=1846217 RepID=UPI0025D5E73B|nr:RES family NAD+ phosphorylase [uncultured Thiodictyon sp.]